MNYALNELCIYLALNELWYLALKSILCLDLMVLVLNSTLISELLLLLSLCFHIHGTPLSSPLFAVFVSVFSLGIFLL